MHEVPSIGTRHRAIAVHIPYQISPAQVITDELKVVGNLLDIRQRVGKDSK